MTDELENVVDDNPNAPDNDEVDLRSLLEAGAEDDEEDAVEDDDVTADDDGDNVEGNESDDEDEGDENTDEEDVTEESSSEAEPAKKVFHEEDVNRIVQERLARDRKTQAVRELEEVTGMDMDSILEYVRNNKIQAKAEEYGISEEEARRIVDQEQQLAQLQEQMQLYQQQQEEIQKTTEYNKEKTQFLNNPLVKKYEKEIDEFANNGMRLNFSTAMNYILGQKVFQGEILESVRNAAEQKTLANVNKRGKAKPERGSTGGKTSAPTLSDQEKAVARMLGISPKEYAAAKTKR